MSVVELERIPWTDADPPKEADLHARLEADGFAPWRWTDAPGADYPPHSHPHDESLWCLRGSIDFVVEGTTYALSAGDRLQLPAGTTHSAKAGPGGATYLIGERRG